MPSIKQKKQLRLRVFAGPNGSGKSTVIKYIKEYKINDNPVDFGYYINADEITETLKKTFFDFGTFKFITSNKEFIQIVLASGLINDEFTEEAFKKSYSFRNNQIRLRDKSSGRAACSNNCRFFT